MAGKVQDRHALWKWLILILLVTGSLAILSGGIQQGIDIQGGTSVLIEIDKESLLGKLIEDRPEDWKDLSPEKEEQQLQEYLKGAQERTLEVLRNRVDNLGIAEPVIFPEKAGRIVIQMPGITPEKRADVIRAIKSAAYLQFRLVHADNKELTDALFQQSVSPKGYQLVTFGSEYYYQRMPDQIPTGDEFGAYRRRLRRFHAPPAHDFMLEKRTLGNRELYRPHFVDRREQLTGEYLKTARVDYQASGLPAIGIEFNSDGTKRFTTLTSDYSPRGERNADSDVGRQLAIVLDGTLYSAPNLIEPIPTGRAQITGSFSLKDATDLANVLKAGSLPAPVRIAEQREVAPSLGQDSINSGVMSIQIGAIAIVLFMLLYYLLSGVIANIALALNIILLPLGMVMSAGFLGIFSGGSGGSSTAIQLPVLTLPGIAGILLTIGIAVDANVLIFERIREEFRSKKSLWNAVTSGYDRAFLTILDANLTTLITGIILFIFGSGPIRGFAVTLCAGIIVSMYTSLVVTRMLYQLLASYTGLKSLKMLAIISADVAIDFVGKRRLAAVFSIVLIVATWGVMITKGVQNPGSIFGVDFTGGASVTFTYSEELTKETRPGVDELRAALGADGLSNVQIQYQRELKPGGKEYLVIRTSTPEKHADQPGQIVTDALETRFADAQFRVAQEDAVGPQVGRELKWRAAKAIVLALIAIVIYITIRFEFGFAIGAIVALVHDVLLTVGIFSLFGREISLPIIAALLTIVGYSVNDTIVVFDRIREDLRLVRDRDFAGICNLSINQTLSRTLLTSVTTLLAVGIMLVFGGGAINDFALALCVGVMTGTYSSIFVATPVVLAWHKGEKPEISTATPKAAA